MDAVLEQAIGDYLGARVGSVGVSQLGSLWYVNEGVAELPLPYAGQLWRGI